MTEVSDYVPMVIAAIKKIKPANPDGLHRSTIASYIVGHLNTDTNKAQKRKQLLFRRVEKQLSLAFKTATADGKIIKTGVGIRAYYKMAPKK